MYLRRTFDWLAISGAAIRAVEVDQALSVYGKRANGAA
jgi:hypothetical protein